MTIDITQGGTEMASAARALVLQDVQPSLEMELPETQTFEEWTEAGRSLASANKVLNWYIGDWWAAGSHRYGDRARLAAEGIFGREFGSLANMASVCRAFPTSRRREHLSFSHHQEVAGLSPTKADQLLDRADREGWSTRELRAEAIIARDNHQPRWFETRPRTVFDRDKAKEAVFECLSEAAKLGDICPTADELAEVAGVESVSTTVALMHILEEEKRIEVRRFQKSRSVTIIATGHSTAEPSNQTPHWREQPRDIPAPTVEAVTQRKPDIAQMIFAAAKRKGRSPQEYLADLVWLGWEVECARDSHSAQNAE